MAQSDRDSLADALTRMSRPPGDTRGLTSAAADENAGGNADESVGISPSANPGPSQSGDDRAGDDQAGDDRAVIPPPPRSAFAPKRSTRQLLAERQLDVKRTVIPILLTCGTLLLAGGALKWVGGPNLPFAAWDARVAAGLCACGLVVLLVGVVNMLQVRSMGLQRDARAQQTRPRHGV